jgi:putative oxidoreductase
MTPLRSVARGMLAAIFVSEGINALRDPERLVGPAKPVAEKLAPTLERIHPKIPTDAKTLVQVNGATQVIAGVLLATGRATTPAALALAGSLVPTTLAGHPYWKMQDPEERRKHQVSFLSNVGLIGGLLFAALDNEGRPGIVWRTGNLAHRAKKAAVHDTKFARREAKRAVKFARREAKIALLTAKDALPTGS